MIKEKEKGEKKDGSIFQSKNWNMWVRKEPSPNRFRKNILNLIRTLGEPELRRIKKLTDPPFYVFQTKIT